MKSNQYLVNVMSFGQKFIYSILVLIWLATLFWFWQWWITPSHIVTIPGFIITSFVLFWSTIVPGWYYFFAGRMKRPNPDLPLPTGRIAMIVTRAPSEPWAVARHTLECMLAQQYPTPFDVWLADEDPNDEIRSWCSSHRVRISSRKGIPEYNRETWPHRQKCKEGNLNYFYDKVGFSTYDFVVQMDADHAPGNSQYLRNMIAPFLNPKVGYVAAPSICDANNDESWTVRARLYSEAGLHGSMQAGYNGDGWSPMCIGSHFAVRTAALKMVGGLGPELAEDHSTTLLLNNAGWDGVFAFDAIAHGDGAASIGSSMTQEYQWSRSLMRIALEWMPKFSSGLTLKKRFLFGFAQWWYPIFALQMVLAISAPTIAILSGVPWVSVPYFDFFWRFLVLTLVCLLPIGYVRNLGCFRPSYSPLISWEAILFQLVRWPWIVIGCAHGTLSAIFKIEFNFVVTPKGKDKAKPLGFTSIFPYFLIIMVSCLAVLYLDKTLFSEGYRWLAMMDSTSFTVLLGVIVVRHIMENTKNIRALLSAVPGILMFIVCVYFLGKAILITPLPFTTTVYAEEQQATPTPDPQSTPSEYVSVRTQIGPTPQPTTENIQKIIATAVPIFPTPTPAPVIELAQDKMLTGMYDPAGTFKDVPLDIEHYFTDWNDPSSIEAALSDAEKMKRFPMLTIQPLHRPELFADTTLPDIANGKYEDIIIKMINTIKKHAPQKVIVRWGHEMDLCRIYDWSSCNATDYIAAYRHVVDLSRSMGATNILWMWSPAGGNPNTKSFYPGDDYVDYIGITGLVSEDWDRHYGNTPQPQGFKQILDQRYNLAPTFNKPLIVAEVGISYSDPDIDREKWLTEAFKAVKDRERYPLLAGWVYFNELNRPNPHIAILPDFRITMEEFNNAWNNAGGF